MQRCDTELVVAAQQGSPRAFEQLVERYKNLVTFIAFSRTGDIQLSEDIAQQAFLTAWTKRNELREPERFVGWLRTITRNHVLNNNRQRQRRAIESTGASEFDPVADTFEQPSAASSRREQQQLLWSTLENMPVEYREPLVLYYREEKSVRDVADQMGLSIDAVKQRLARGRAMLKSEVEQFVEDLLGATRPQASFVLAVMSSMKASSIVVGEVAAKGTAAVGAKTMLSKIGMLATGPFLGAIGGLAGGGLGVAGAWYGTKTAAGYATSQQEKDLLWWFFHVVTVVTIVLTVGSVAGAMMITAGTARLVFVIVATVVYVVALTGLIWYFLNRQWSLHREFGKPAYPSEIAGTKTATANQLRLAIVGSTVGCWAWLIVLSIITRNWLALGIAVPVMLGYLAWRLINVNTLQSLPQQLRAQGSGVLANMILAAAIMLLTGWMGVGLYVESLPNWALAMFVVAAGWLIAISLWYAAAKADAS